MAAGYVPDAGDIVWLQFDPQAGHEQAGHRPAVVLSPASYNGRTGMIICCPTTCGTFARSSSPIRAEGICFASRRAARGPTGQAAAHDYEHREAAVPRVRR